MLPGCGLQVRLRLFQLSGGFLAWNRTVGIFSVCSCSFFFFEGLMFLVVLFILSEGHFNRVVGDI